MKVNWSQYRSGHKNRVVLGPKRDQNGGRVAWPEIVLRSLLVHHLRPAFFEPTGDCEIGFPGSSRKTAYVIDLASLSFVCRHASDTSESSKEPFGKGVERISRHPFFVDISTARGGMEAEEILYSCQVGSVNSFVKTTSPGAGLVWDREPSLDRLLRHF